MECPYCEKELEHHDVFGFLAAHQSGKVNGDIYRCENVNCEAFNESFYAYRDRPDNLIEGYPC